MKFDCYRLLQNHVAHNPVCYCHSSTLTYQKRELITPPILTPQVLGMTVTIVTIGKLSQLQQV